MELNEKGEYAGDWGSGERAEVPMEAQAYELALSVAQSDDGRELLIETVKREEGPTGSGEEKGLKRLPFPQGARLESRWRKDRVVIQKLKYHALWEGRFVREGKTVKTLLFVMRATNDPEAKISESFGHGDPEGNLKELVRVPEKDSGAMGGMILPDVQIEQ